MSKNKLNLNMEHFDSLGLFLTTEEQLVLLTSLPVLQQENKFSSVVFKGKIFGTENDYYIAQGIGEDFIRNRMNFYSTDGYSWSLLFPPTEDSLKSFHMVRTRFNGDPTSKHRFYKDEETEKAELKEEHRLSALLKLMDFETALGPKNSILITPKGIIERNPAFKGLPVEEALKLESYLHYRLPASDLNFRPNTLIRSPGGDRARSFLEPISRDYPPGCWTLQSDHLEEVVTLRNLFWPGFVFYHIPITGEFNSMYMGYGERNDDLAFML